MSLTETVSAELQNETGLKDAIIASSAAAVAVYAADAAAESADAAAESADAAAESADAAAESAEQAGVTGAEAAAAVVEAAQEAAEQEIQDLTFEQVEQDVEELQEILARNEDACQDPSVVVDVRVGNEKILSAADSIIDNMTAEHLYDIYQLMDCKDNWTTSSQKVTLAAGTASVAQLAMIGVKALIGSATDLESAASKIATLEAELAITKLALKDTEANLQDCEVNLFETGEELLETERELAETEQELAETEQELAETEQELAATETELTETETELVETEQELAQAECENNKLENALKLVLNLDGQSEDAVEEVLNNDDCVSVGGIGIA